MVPDGWLVAAHKADGEIVATGMALRDCCEFGEQGGEIGWIATAPAHRGNGIGHAIVAAATARLLTLEYRNVHLYTEPWRVQALRLYLKLGYVPLLDTREAMSRWRAICDELDWPFTPERWVRPT